MHYLKDEGSKTHSKGYRVRKHTTQKMMMKHQSVNVESNAL
jgi:hypothetical protein